VVCQIIKSVCLVELKGIMRLWVDVNSDNVKASAVITHACTTTTTTVQV
jgi:hypothetical protein